MVPPEEFVIEPPAVVEQAGDTTPEDPNAATEKPAWEKKVDAIFEGKDPDEVPDDPPAKPPADPAAPPPTDPKAEKPKVDKPKEPPAADPKAAAPAAATGEGAPEGEGDDAIVLRLPGRHADDEDVELELPPEVLEKAGIDAQQFTERQNQLRNGFMRGEEVRAAKSEIAEGRSYLDTIERELQEQPIDFLTSRVPVEQYGDVAEALLIQLPDEVFDKLLDKVAKWERDPSTRRDERATAKEQRIERNEQRRKDGEKNRNLQNYQAEISTALVDLIPADMDVKRADEFFDFALYKLEAYARTHKGTRLRGDQIPALLEQLGALEPFGLAADGVPPTPPADPAAKGRRAATRPVDATAEAAARKTGQDLRARADRRKNAATAPAGAGSPAAADAVPPKGQTIDQRLEWISKHFRG